MRRLFVSSLISLIALGSLVSSVKAQDTTMPMYTDSSEISDWAVPYVEQLKLEGIMVGYADGSFRPKANLTREEFASALYNAMVALDDKVQAAIDTNNEALYAEITSLQLQVLELADKEEVANDVVSRRNWVGVSIGATAVDNNDSVIVALDGKYSLLDVAGLYVSINPFVSTAGEGGAALMVNKELGEKITVSAGAGAAVGFNDNNAITSEAGDVEGYGQAQVEYDLSKNTNVYVNGRVPFTGDNSGDVTIMGGFGYKF